MISYQPNGNDKCFVLSVNYRNNFFFFFLVENKEAYSDFYTVVAGALFFEWRFDEQVVRIQGELLWVIFSVFRSCELKLYPFWFI